jgi:hypothetical protein
VSGRRRNTYRVGATFAAPLDFVYRWCTNFTARDARLTGDRYRRWVLERTARRVVFEDLATTVEGWKWLRNVVTLRPPDRWHLDVVGNSLDGSWEYRLRRHGEDRTHLTMKGALWPGVLGWDVPPRSQVESSLREVWRKYGRALERDYRAGRSYRG